MGIIAIVYTGTGGLKAVIYTDTIQWAILLVGLIFIGIPFAYYTTGGWDVISTSLSKEFFSLSNITWQQLVNWGFTIIPIWFVGMTLYQRIYASKSTKEAQKAWYIAGLFEYPVMAFMGVILGLLGKVAFDANMFADIGYAAGSSIDEEMGLPLLLNHVLPVGLLGLMLAAYFSAILSTADSCLMAASGNVQTDLLGKWRFLNKNKKHTLRISQIITILIGAFALLLASNMQNVLSLMLYSYAFMVSGLLLPVIGALYWKKASPLAALVAMIGGGGTTISLIALDVNLPLNLDANIFGITISTILFFCIGIIQSKLKHK